MARLNVKYKEEIAPSLMQKFQYKSVMQIPKVSKVIVNVGCGVLSLPRFRRSSRDGLRLQDLR